MGRIYDQEDERYKAQQVISSLYAWVGHPEFEPEELNFQDWDESSRDRRAGLGGATEADRTVGARDAGQSIMSTTDGASVNERRRQEYARGGDFERPGTSRDQSAGEHHKARIGREVREPGEERFWVKVSPERVDWRTGRKITEFDVRDYSLKELVERRAEWQLGADEDEKIDRQVWAIKGVIEEKQLGDQQWREALEAKDGRWVFTSEQQCCSDGTQQ